MIYPGTDLKFKVTATIPDFSFAGNPFMIIVKNSFGRVRYRIGKSDCLFDSEGNCYFPMKCVAEGCYTAFFTGAVDDADFSGLQQRITDEQHLCDVGRRHCRDSRCQSDHQVSYERCYTRNVEGKVYLADKDGNLITTSDDQAIELSAASGQNASGDNSRCKLNMTGDEFKQLIEGHDPNGEVNTIPELMDAMKGIAEDTTVRDEIDGTLTEDDLENIFFEPVVTDIRVEVAEHVTLTATTKNISPTEAVTWRLSFDTTQMDISGKGAVLTLDAVQQAAFTAATTVTACLICSDYKSDVFIIKG